jgi:ectoine hydrolase
MCWATGYDGWSFYVHQAVVVGGRGRADLVGPRHRRRRRPAHDHRRARRRDPAYDDSYVQNDDKHPMETLAALLAEKGWDAG